eukprot:COSAG05_NODE_55_length_23493_cov_709.337907_8_plen_114_part_00
MLSPYAANLQQQLGISKDACEKLVPNLQETNYVVDIRNLKFYRDHDDLIIKRVHAVITFRQERWILSLMQWIVTSSRSTARLNPCISTPDCSDSNAHLTLLKLEILRRIKCGI